MEKSIVLAGGCFWGTQALFDNLQGVLSTEAGYANNTLNKDTLSYEEVCSGNTGAAEAVKVRYENAKITLEELLVWFFKSINPTQINAQGNDVGTQYRSGIYWENESDLEAINKIFKSVELLYDEDIATEIAPLENFIPAEEYHQKYLEKNRGGYCHVPQSLLFRAAQREPSTGAVAFSAGTERAFTGMLDKQSEPGIYVDIFSGTPLFSSKDKFDAGCGWPSFTRTLPNSSISEHTDKTLGMIRTEVVSDSSNAHLGHVFNDGPKEETGLRYCINSAVLAFVPLKYMDLLGYGDYKQFVVDEK